MSIEAMKQALKVLEYPGPSWIDGRQAAITSLRQAIEQADKQEPVAWIFKPNRELLWPHEIERKNSLELNEYVPLYFHTHPNREWVGLTDEEKRKITRKTKKGIIPYKIIEAKLKQKNGIKGEA